MTNIVATGQITLVDLNDAKSLSAYIKANQSPVQIVNPDDSSVSPDWTVSPYLVLTPELYVTGTPDNIIANAKTVTWYENGTKITSGSGGYTIPASGVKTLTINQNKLSNTTKFINYTCEIVWTDSTFGADISVKTDIGFSRISAGGSSVTGVLSNESAGVFSDANGGSLNFSGAVTTMSIFLGATDDSANWTVAKANETGISGTLSGKTYTVTGMTADNGYVDLVATKGTTTITKRFVATKNKQGTSATAYWLVSSASAVGKSIGGVFTPGSITFTAKQQTGSSAAAAYSGRLFVETYNGSAWTTVNDTDTSSYTYTFTNGSSVQQVRATLYVAGAKTNQLDQETVPVLLDGAKGDNAVISYVWAPNGNIVKNASGSITLDCDIYNGVSAVTGSAYQWYKYDSTATIANGKGDAAGGDYWLKLSATNDGGGTTGYATSVLTVPASAVTSMTPFKCVATYGGNTYVGSCTVVDQSDPIQVALISAEGTVFRNGEGTKNITAKIYRGGVELDSAGTGYEYRWNLRNEAGVVDTTFVDNVPDPTAAPTLAVSGSGGTTAAGTYYVTYTWVNKNGETKVSPEKSIVVTAGQTVTVTLPAFPQGAVSSNIYIGTATGTGTKQGNTISTTYTKNTVISAGTAKPSANTTGSTVYKTGKTLTVLSDNVTNIGNLVLELWTLN